jgi:pimeloyl-ACP methyl ester carboxylesterase
MRILPALVLAAILAGCGGGHGPAVERVHFRATDGVLLDGRLYGSGDKGVVLVHMGRGGDTQNDWSGVARLLAGNGFLVLTYDRRGVCVRNGTGCSEGIDDYARSWKDIVGAARFLRSQEAEMTVVAGASIGAMASLYAASRHEIEPAGLIEFAGINHASGYDFDRLQIRRIRGLKLFLSARNDAYGGGDAAQQWFRWASPPKRLELLPGTAHGTDLLQPGSPVRRRVEQLLVQFVEEAGRSTH